MYTEVLQNFTEDNLPELDEVVMGALDLFDHVAVPEVDFSLFKRPLVVGSVNGAAAGELIFADQNAVFANESDYQQKLDVNTDIDGAFLISASGSKHALPIAADLQSRNIRTILVTNNEAAPAKEHIAEGDVFVFPKNREPYTYNTSTYMGMMIAKTKEDPGALLTFLHNEVKHSIPDDLSKYKAFCIIIPPEYNAMAAMFRTKFDELFGPELVGRVFTTEQMKHAKTVVYSEAECFVSLGGTALEFGHPDSRLTLSLPEGHDLVAVLATGYYFIGHIQKQFPPFFKRDIKRYVASASKIFGSEIPVIVE